MSEQVSEIDVSTTWFSTYGLLTSQRILESLRIFLSTQELRDVIKNPKSFYFQLLRLPLKHILTGIILEQARDYQVYAQKLFVDYLISGEANNESAEEVTGTQETLEQKRRDLVLQCEEYTKHMQKYHALIAEGQKTLIEITNMVHQALNAATHKIELILKNNECIVDKELIQKGLRTLFIYYDVMDEQVLSSGSLFWEGFAQILNIKMSPPLQKEIQTVLAALEDPQTHLINVVSPYLEQAEDIGVSSRAFRRHFMDIIVQVMELIRLLPDYRLDEARELSNRESLLFDAKIGGD